MLEEIREKIKYCEYCGEKLVARYEFDGYDEETGERRYLIYRTCPYRIREEKMRRGFFGIFRNYDDLNHSNIVVVSTRNIKKLEGIQFLIL